MEKVKQQPSGAMEGSVAGANPVITQRTMSMSNRNPLSARLSILRSAAALLSPSAKKRTLLQSIVGTPLTSMEIRQAQEIWETLIRDAFASSAVDVHALISALHVPTQPLMDRMVDEAFLSSGKRFNFRQFSVLLEQCKTVHSKWLHKLRGKILDDDLLEAFVAVGGQTDSNGSVDIAKMRSVISEFNLRVDIDRIVNEMDSDGGGDINFGEFASLIRDNAPAAGAGANRRKLQDDDGGPDNADDIAALDAFLSIEGLEGGVGAHGVGPVKPITLSNRMYMDEDADKELLFPEKGPNPNLTPGVTARRTTAAAGGSTDIIRIQRQQKQQQQQQGEVTPTGAALAKDGSGAPTDSRLLPPLAGRTKLHGKASSGGQQPPVAGAGTGGGPNGSQAYYKGGGGLRNMTPSPTRVHMLKAESPQRSNSSMQKKPAKIHKFAN